MVNEGQFYDWSEILSKKCKGGGYPRIIMVCSSHKCRSIGKTTGMAHEMIKKFYTHEPSALDNLPLEGNKFVLLCRQKQTLGKLAAGIFTTALDVYYPGVIVKEKIAAKGMYSDIYFVTGTDKDKKETHVGWVVPLSGYDGVKLLANTWGDCGLIFQDEFQPEMSESYLNDELTKWRLVTGSLRKGKSNAAKYLPVVMCSNTVSLFSPYMVECGLHKRVKPDTKWVKTDKVIFNKPFMEEIAKQVNDDYFDSANDYANDDSDNSWINDDSVAICKPDGWGPADYYCSLICADQKFAVKYYRQMGYYYVDTKVDETYPTVYNIRLKSMEPNVPIIKTAFACKVLRDAMQKGVVRFSCMEAKMALYDLFIN